MFELDWAKLLVIAVVALVFIGPKELPSVLRTVGQWMGKIRRMAAEFQGQFQEAMREAEMADLKKHIDTINEAATNLPSTFDPLETARKDIESAIEDKPAGTAPPASQPSPAAGAADAPASAAPPVDVPVPVPEPHAPVTDKAATSTPEAAPAAPPTDAGGRPP